MRGKAAKAVVREAVAECSSSRTRGEYAVSARSDIRSTASTDQIRAKAAEFNSDQQGSRYRSAELHLLRTHHSRLAE